MRRHRVHRKIQKSIIQNSTPKKHLPVGTCTIVVEDIGIGEARYWEHIDWKDAGGIQPYDDLPASSTTSDRSAIYTNIWDFLYLVDWEATIDKQYVIHSSGWINGDTAIPDAVRTFYVPVIESTGVIAKQLQGMNGLSRRNVLYNLITQHGLQWSVILENSKTVGVHTEIVAEHGGAMNSDGTSALRHKGHQLYDTHTKWTLTIHK